MVSEIHWSLSHRNLSEPQEHVNYDKENIATTVAALTLLHVLCFSNTLSTFSFFYIHLRKVHVDMR